MVLDDASTAIGDLRRPEYTGENRCLPCTVVNLAISAVVAGLAALVSPALGVVLFVFSAGVIYLRGYLMPGTPSLTARYLPESAKQYFGTHATSADGGIAGAKEDGNVDDEQFLRDAGVLTECEDFDDLCLTDEFRSEWRDAADRLASDEAARAALADLVGVDTERIDVKTGTNAIGAHEETVVTAGGMEVARWESRGAMLADLATAATLAERQPAWSSLDFEQTGSVLLHLRVFLETCPLCGGHVSMGKTTYDGCCGPEYTVEATCTDCGEFLIRPPEQRL